MTNKCRKTVFNHTIKLSKNKKKASFVPYFASLEGSNTIKNNYMFFFDIYVYELIQNKVLKNFSPPGASLL
jgi:cadmium resistance protein CadD (predicted permease)